MVPAPILTLPYDLVVEILLTTYLSDYPSDLDHQDYDYERRILSQVCKSWRDAVLDTPSFWTDIPITTDSADFTVQLDYSDPLQVLPDHARKVFPYISKILERSGRVLPLRIHMDLEVPDSDRPPEFDTFPWTIAHSFALGNILMPHAARFQRLQLSSQALHPIIGLLSSLADQSMPLLEYAECTRTRPYKADLQHPDFPEPSSSCFASPAEVTPSPELKNHLFPQLRHFSLSGVPQLWSQFIPRYGLVSLRLEWLPEDRCPTYFELKNLLHSQQTLQTLRLVASTPMPDSSVGPDDKILLPNLTELSFSFNTSLSTVFFIEHTDFPNLVSLDLVQMLVFEECTPSHVYDTMTLAWSCLWQISHLTLRYVNFSSEEYETIDGMELAFFEERVPLHSPRMIWFFFACIRLKTLHLLECDKHTLQCLLTPVWSPMIANPPGAFSCRELERLEIENHYDVKITLDFLKVNTFWSNLPTSMITPRKVNVMVVHTMPHMGSLIKEVIKPNTAVELRNGSFGYFLVHGVEDEIENLMDHVRA
ncbi:hypothetical protein GYMLUDRAFT_264402 [Collybiopsis luxurians FD-317 M1]|uniref:F-box domain-containing protein n=1 Tax=Collybiopsis luxurians FD-317 M1 TaxID=944289 RepID=A0A0D0BJ81_9AGAR|nr:hypothetical protein GYMLUDRAFT_264402 [Collybiopsis luxurians FD-317 M1]